MKNRIVTDNVKTFRKTWHTLPNYYPHNGEEVFVKLFERGDTAYKCLYRKSKGWLVYLPFGEKMFQKKDISFWTYELEEK